LVAHEIRDVPADRHLAPKPVPLYLLRAQDCPDPPFRVGHVPPQRASARVCVRCGVFLHVLASHHGALAMRSASPARFIVAASPSAKALPLDGGGFGWG